MTPPKGLWFLGAILGLLSPSFITFAKSTPIIDQNVWEKIYQTSSQEKFYSLFIFLKAKEDVNPLINHLKKIKHVSVLPLSFMPVVIVTFPKQQPILAQLLNEKNILAISLNQSAGEKEDFFLWPKTNMGSHVPTLPGLKLWWNKGYHGQHGVVGIIDSGIAQHSALAHTRLLINRETIPSHSGFIHGIRSPHGTGVACIYAGYSKTPPFQGIAYRVPIVLSTIAGEGGRKAKDFYLTYQGLNWLLSHPYRPWVINYSFGNGWVSCKDCPDWSGMAKIVDYIINRKKILWVTSAGNKGYVKPHKHYPYASTLTVPADSYNALTIANMDRYTKKSKLKGLNRFFHAIRYTSSRGPTLLGRKKPDLTAPGNDTLTCAPDKKKYKMAYKREMKYKNGYRLMGGTSTAAPHIGAAIVLLREAGIKNPMAAKALLINSADTWADNDTPGPEDPVHPNGGGHHFVWGSQWNSTYGWGYINLKTAFYQRHYIKQDKVTVKHPVREYKVKLLKTDKVTLVHESRVGFSALKKFWRA